MTTLQAGQIRQLVDAGGWAAVRNHTELGPIWEAAVMAAAEYTNRVVDN
jgi:hypothetical protein